MYINEFQEIWYEEEVTPRGEDNWAATGGNADTLVAAREHPAPSNPDFEYRIVRKTLNVKVMNETDTA